MPILPSLSSSTPQLPPAATGVKQTIQARSGTATFVPKGHTITIINTYGRQVVDMWAFALHAVPTEEELAEENRLEKDFMKQAIAEQEKSEEQVAQVDKDKTEESDEKKTEETLETHESGKDAAEDNQEDKEKQADETSKAADAKGKDAVEETGDEESSKDKMDESTMTDAVKVEREDASDSVDKLKSLNDSLETSTEQLTESEKSEEKPKSWASYIPSVRGRAKPATDSGEATDSSPKSTKSWSAYIPSVNLGKKDGQSHENSNKESRTWASYIPSGHGYSSYIPKDAISSIGRLHQRDPSKSVAEQLYDFSKTPAGVAGISIATGSGYASSLYAAYAAYNRSAGLIPDRGAPGMEYLSMEHSRASTQHISPRVGDLMVSNLRAPMITLLYDTSPGAHDTLMAACDPMRYKELGVEKWAQHGSCAENLMLSLEELNKSVGLKGRKAIGCDVTVNSLPAPLNLFMNIPFTRDGYLSFEPPKGKRGDFVKFRAERDLVMVMSACPQDILEVNGRKPMVAHFVVDSPSEEDSKVAELRDREAQEIIEKARARMEFEMVPRQPSPTGTTTPKATPMSPSTESYRGMPKFTPRSSASSVPQRPKNPPKLEHRNSSQIAGAQGQSPQKREVRGQTSRTQTQTPKRESLHTLASTNSMKKLPQQPGKKKPRKLERRMSSAPTTPKV